MSSGLRWEEIQRALASFHCEHKPEIEAYIRLHPDSLGSLGRLHSHVADLWGEEKIITLKILTDISEGADSLVAIFKGAEDPSRDANLLLSLDEMQILDNPNSSVADRMVALTEA